MPRTVLFGATGYTGGLAAAAMARRGLAPVLAGRRRGALEEVAARLGGADVAVADAARPESLRPLVGEGDVLVTTVGPMTRWGEAALDAARHAGAHYVDSSGESAWVRRVFEDRRPARALVLPAIGYDSVPGNLAGALALREAGPDAVAVRIGYFVTGGRRRGLRDGLDHMSGGSRATFAAMATQPAFAWRGGRLATERPSARVGAYLVGGRRWRGVSFGTSEAFSLPRLRPGLRDVDVHFGWFDGASRLLQAGSLALAAPLRLAPLRRAIGGVAARIAGRGPDEPAIAGGSLFVAEALDARGRRLARVRLEGIAGYEFTGDVLAWAAQRAAAGAGRGHGALGPVEAFGIEPLQAGVAECGIARVAE